MVFDGGGAPLELFEIDLAQRMGWTLSELDEQDAARVIIGLHLQDTRDSLHSILRFLESGGQHKPSEDDLKIYEEVQRLMKEDGHAGPDTTSDADRTISE